MHEPSSNQAQGKHNLLANTHTDTSSSGKGVEYYRNKVKIGKKWRRLPDASYTERKSLCYNNTYDFIPIIVHS